MDDLELEGQTSSRPGTPVDLGRLLSDLGQRWRLIPVVAAIALVAGVAYAHRTVQMLYKTRTALLYEGKGGREELITLVDSITLRANIKEVKRRLKSKSSLKDLLKRINVQFDTDSHLVVVSTEANTGKKAAKLANTTVEVFLDYQRRVFRDQMEERQGAIETDLAAAKVRVRNRREAYDTFRREVGVGDFKTAHKVALEQAVTMRQKAELAAAAAQTEAARAEKMSEAAKTQSRTITAGGTVVNPDQDALAAARTQLNQDKARLSPDHPRILALQAKIATLQERVKSRANVLQSTVSVAPNAAYLELQRGATTAGIRRKLELHNEQTFKRFADEADQRLQELSRAEGQAKHYLSQIELAEDRVKQLEADRMQVLDKLRSPPTSFRIVTPAGVPDAPDKLTKQKTALRFPLIAVALTLIGLLGYSLRGLRVHTAREAGYWANTPVVASSTWPRDQETLGALVDELSDVAPQTHGTTLVVAARPNEVPLAREVAYWLGTLTKWPNKALTGEEELPEPDVQPSVVVGSGDGESSTALVRTDQLAPVGAEPVMVAQAWDGPTHGPALRRAARLADRVLVVVASGAMSVTDLSQLRTRLGREDGIGLLLVGLDPALERLPDRVGEVDAFWQRGADAVAA
ncbi:MAG: Wzz/FepE/Etk N-terminal domain-containing protein [Myxococcales bacterium]|nr:Wzz/FepE/Etk N-terminal domain-containing protein [Myxococcales bacterium]